MGTSAETADCFATAGAILPVDGATYVEPHVTHTPLGACRYVLRTGTELRTPALAPRADYGTARCAEPGVDTARRMRTARGASAQWVR